MSDKPRWWKARFTGSSRPWFGSDRRCQQWTLGPFYTDWRCVLVWDHTEVEGHPHIYEPDLWPGGRYHEEWIGRGGLERGRSPKEPSQPEPMLCATCGREVDIRRTSEQSEVAVIRGGFLEWSDAGPVGYCSRTCLTERCEAW